MGSARFSAQGFTRPKSRCELAGFVSSPGKESAPKVHLGCSRTLLLCLVGCRTECCFLAGALSSEKLFCLRSLAHGHLHLSVIKGTWNPPHPMLQICGFFSCYQPEKTLLLKGSCDQMRHTYQIISLLIHSVNGCIILIRL